MRWLENLSTFEMVLSALGAGFSLLVAGLVTGYRLGRSRNKKADMEEPAEPAAPAEPDPGEKIAAIHRLINDNSASFWHMMPVEFPDAYIRTIHDRAAAAKPVLCIANLKGGVGKTTVAANLAAYFDQVLERRVLMVDLDFQGSLSAICLGAAGIDQVNSLADSLFTDGREDDWVDRIAIPLGGALPRSRLITAFYGFDLVENAVLLRWLLGESSFDPRYILFRYVLNAAMADAFDVVIFDCPPRLMTATVAALCASTHLLIPTVMDGLSSGAVTTFLSQVRDLRPLAPALTTLGVVPTLTQHGDRLAPNERIARNAITENTATLLNEAVHIFEAEMIPRRAAIAQAAGQDLAFNTNNEARAYFERLGAAINVRVGA